jgi:hypothetical protein
MNGVDLADHGIRLCQSDGLHDLKRLARVGKSSANRQLTAEESRIWSVPFGFDQARRPFLPMFVTKSRRTVIGTRCAWMRDLPSG